MLAHPREVFVVDVALSVISLPLLLLRLCVIVRLQNLLLQPAWALVKDGEELFCELLYLVQICIRVHVSIPSLPLKCDLYVKDNLHNNAAPLRRWESHIWTIYRRGGYRRRPQWWGGSAGTSWSGGESLLP